MHLDIDRLQNLDVFDRHGDKIGAIGQIYVDDNTGEPTFVTVKTGLFGTRETFVPVQNAEQMNDGLRVPFDKSYVKDAPNIDSDGHLSESEQHDLYHYYGIGDDDLGQHGGRSQYPDEEGRRGAPAVGTAGYGDERRAARDDADRRGDARHTQSFGRDDVTRDNLRDDQRVYADDDLSRDDLTRDGLIDDDRGRREQRDVDAAKYERTDSGSMGDAGAAGAAGAMGAAATALQRERSRDGDRDRVDDRDDVDRVDLTDRDDRRDRRDDVRDDVRDDRRDRRDDRDDIGQAPDADFDRDRDRDRERDWDRDRDREPRRGSGGARLRKYTVTEMKTVQVPVQREVVELDGDDVGARVDDDARRDDQGVRDDVREGDVRDTLDRDNDQRLRRD